MQKRKNKKTSAGSLPYRGSPRAYKGGDDEWSGFVTWARGIRTEGEDTTILVDPFLTGNPSAAAAPGDYESVDFIFVTHGHGDHLGDTVEIASRTGATVAANFELCHYLGGKGLKCHPMHIGGAFNFPFGRVKMTPALHGSDITEGDHLIPGGSPCGFLFDLGGVKIYHAGDTGLTMDMQLLALGG